MCFKRVNLSLCLSQMPHPGRMDPSQNALQQQQQQQHSSVHGNQGHGGASSPMHQRNSTAQNPRLQAEGTFGLGGPAGPGGEGPEHALDVSVCLFSAFV